MTIYELNNKIQILGLESAVYNQERVIMARVRYLLIKYKNKSDKWQAQNSFYMHIWTTVVFSEKLEKNI